MHERDTRAIVLDGVLDRGADQTLGTRLRNRLDADSGVLTDGPAEALLQQRDELVGLGCSLFELEARVDVFGVLAEDHHVDGLGALHRRRHPREPPHGAKAHVQVEELTQRDVERPEAAADRRRQRTLDADQVIAKGVDRLVGKPRAGRVERLLAREHLFPRDLLAVLRGRGVHHEPGGRPDVDSGSVAFDVGDDGLVGNRERAIGLHRDLLGHGLDVSCPIRNRAPRGASARRPPLRRVRRRRAGAGPARSRR